MSKALRICSALAVILLVAFSFSSAQESGNTGEVEVGEDGSKLVVKGITEDIPLPELIQLYSEYMDRPVMYDPKKISGNITIAAPQDGAKLSLEDTLLSALAEYRLTIVSDGVFDKIVPAAEACTMAETIAVEELDRISPSRFVRIVVQLQNADANAVRGAAQNLTTRQGGMVNPVSGINALIICDYAHNLQMIVKMIEQMEAESATETRVIRLQHVDYKNIHDAVGACIDKQGRRPGGPMGISIGYTQDLKTITITGQVREVERISQVVAKLDMPDEE